MTTTAYGSIKRVIAEKGFGFISDGKGDEYFFHATSLVTGEFADLAAGDRVSFTPTQGPKGPRAEGVSRL